MKTILPLLLFLGSILGTVTANAQGGRNTLELPVKVRTSDYTLSISNVQTTTLVFPHDVVSVDRGTPDVLTQTLDDVTNIVKVKAAHDELDLTSLTVITAGGKVYTFRVRYDRYPATLTFDLAHLNDVPTRYGEPALRSPAAIASPAYYGLMAAGLAHLASFPAPDAQPEAKVDGTTSRSATNPMGIEYANTGVSAAYIDVLSQQIANEVKFKPQKKDRAVGSRLALNDIWIDGDIIYYRFTLANESQISYDLDFWRFFIVDAKKAKRTAVQERDVDILNVYASGSEDRVEAKDEVTYVVALNKFTISDRKNLMLELFERSGGRHHSIKLKNKHIVSAKVPRPLKF